MLCPYFVFICQTCFFFSFFKGRKKKKDQPCVLEEYRQLEIYGNIEPSEWNLGGGRIPIQSLVGVGNAKNEKQAGTVEIYLVNWYLSPGRDC